MEIYETEEQQVDALKAYWKENGTAIIAGLVIGFSGFIGYNLYNDHKSEQELATADAYQTVLDNSEKDSAAFTNAAEAFISENGDSSYASLTALSLAKEAADHKDWAKAEQYLTTAVEKSSVAGVKAIAVLRLARVQIQLAQIDKALVTLATALPESFKSSIEETKGDAYLQQGKTELARTAYQAAIDAESKTPNPGLQMKLDDLAEIVILTK